MDMDRIRNLIIGFALISLIAAAGAIALFEFQSNEKPKSITSTTNETITLSSTGNGSTGTVSQRYMFISLSQVRNESSQELVNSTVAYCNTTGGTFNCNATGSTICYADYTHYTWTSLVNITNSGLTGVDNTTSYFGTAGTIAGVALLLFIVIGAFYFITRQRT